MSATHESKQAEGANADASVQLIPEYIEEALKHVCHIHAGSVRQAYYVGNPLAEQPHSFGRNFGHGGEEQGFSGAVARSTAPVSVAGLSKYASRLRASMDAVGPIS